MKLLFLLSRLLTIFFGRFEFSLKTADLAARQHASCTHYLRQWGREGVGGRIWLLFQRKFINCLLKHSEIWKQGQFKH